MSVGAVPSSGLAPLLEYRANAVRNWWPRGTGPSADFHSFGVHHGTGVRRHCPESYLRAPFNDPVNGTSSVCRKLIPFLGMSR